MERRQPRQLSSFLLPMSGTLRITLCAVAIATGIAIGFSVWLGGQWLGAGNRSAVDAVFHLMPVKLENISERDRWLMSWDVFFAPVQGLRSDSSYGLLVVLSKQNQPPHPPTGEHGFILDGFESNCEKPVFINGDYLDQNPGTPAIILLDFLTWPRMSDGLLKGKILRLRSAHD